MKKTMIAVFSMLVLSVAAFAQTQEAKHNELPQVKAKKMVSKLNDAVQLTGEQTTKVNNIFIDYYTKRQELKNNTKLGDAARDEREKNIKDTRDRQLKAALTAKQWKDWEAYKEREKKEKKDNNEKD